MIYINLLPVKDIKRRNKARKEFFSLVGLLSVLLAALVAYGGYLYYNKYIQEQNNKILTSQLEDKKKIVSQVEAVDKEIQEQQRRITVINSLRESSLRTVQIFVELANYIPTNRIWLTKLKQTQKDNTLIIRGIALDNSTVALYLEDLRKITDINDAVLIQSSSEKYNDRNIVRFEIRCTLKDLSVK